VGLSVNSTVFTLKNSYNYDLITYPLRKQRIISELICLCFYQDSFMFNVDLYH
jgi:hypothetical protein